MIGPCTTSAIREGGRAERNSRLCSPWLSSMWSWTTSPTKWPSVIPGGRSSPRWPLLPQPSQPLSWHTSRATWPRLETAKQAQESATAIDQAQRHHEQSLMPLVFVAFDCTRLEGSGKRWIHLKGDVINVGPGPATAIYLHLTPFRLQARHLGFRDTLPHARPARLRSTSIFASRGCRRLLLVSASLHRSDASYPSPISAPRAH